MAIKGRIFGVRYGTDNLADQMINSGVNTYAMAALNAGFCARFTATQAKDIASVRIYWNTVTTPGTITVRIETIDAATGKPSGTLYDANAEITGVTPTAGLQTITFASVPTTNLTPGAEYAVVILTTSAGTAHTLRTFACPSGVVAFYPTVVLTAANGTTRSNFAEVSNSYPLCSLVLDDATEDTMGMGALSGATVTNNLINDDATALKLVTSVLLSVAAVEFFLVKSGTPTSNLRIRIFDSANSVVSGATITVDKDSIIVGGRRMIAWFPALVTLQPGTYRVVFDASGDTASGNCWRLNAASPLSAACVPSSFLMSTCPDVATPVWTDTSDQLPVRLVLDDILFPTFAGFQLGVQ